MRKNSRALRYRETERLSSGPLKAVQRNARLFVGEGRGGGEIQSTKKTAEKSSAFLLCRLRFGVGRVSLNAGASDAMLIENDWSSAAEESPQIFLDRDHRARNKLFLNLISMLVLTPTW